jgi:hypothetical protein
MLNPSIPKSAIAVFVLASLIALPVVPAEAGPKEKLRKAALVAWGGAVLVECAVRRVQGKPKGFFCP